jgi:hypothetical protein
MVKTVFEENYITCYFDDSIPVLSHRWKGHVSNENFRAALMRIIDTFKQLKKEYPTIAWLGNTTDLGILSLDTQSWLRDKWTPILIQAEVRHHALVVPKDVFAKFAMNKFKDNADAHHQDSIITGHFPDEKLAHEWLRKLQPALVVK